MDPPCQAASQDASVAEKRIAFDIPAQPLASALEAYSAATGVEIFYDAVLAAGHRSASVKGSFLPARALETLLLGTGYVPRSTGPDTISIAPGPQGTSQQTIAAKRIFDRYQPYFAVLQAQLSRTLCRDDPAKIRSGEVIFKFWLTASGTIARAQIIASDGDADRDRALVQRAEGLEIGEPPPPALPEPITMAVFPPTAGEAPGCPENRDSAGGP